MVKVKNYIEHLGYLFSDPDQYLTCSMCNVYKHISLYRFRNRKYTLRFYLHRYRYGHTRNQFREHVYKYNIQEDIKNTNHCVSTDLSVFDCAVFLFKLSTKWLYQSTKWLHRFLQVWFYLLVTRSH